MPQHGRLHGTLGRLHCVFQAGPEERLSAGISQPEHVHKTAICTSFGLFEFIKMPFGLHNTGQTFQRLMDDILCGLPFVFVYLDDVLIASRTHEEQVQHLQQVLTIFKQHGLVLNGEKCVLGASTVDYLGHKVTTEGISPLPDSVAAIKKFPQPATVQQRQTYLGMLNFYRRFIKGATCVLKISIPAGPC